MRNRKLKYLIITSLLLAFVCVQLNDLSAQSKYSSNKKIEFEEGRYHKKKGWVNSMGLHIFPFAPLIIVLDFADLIGQTYPAQYEYLGFYLVKPKLGLGVSATLTNHQTGVLGYEYFTHYKFVDLAGYTRLYLSNKRGRPFLDFKLGYGIARNNPISFVCYNCEEEGSLYLRYSSGLMFQPGIGLQFSTYKKVKWGIKLSTTYNYTTHQRDRHKKGWETTPEGIIKRTTTERVLGNLFFGINIYI